MRTQPVHQAGSMARRTEARMGTSTGEGAKGWCGDEAVVEPVRRVGSMDRSMDAHMGGEARSEKRRRFSATLALSTLRRSAY